MSDDENSDWDKKNRYSRPSLAQVKALVAHMERHPEYANKKQRLGPGTSKYKKFWMELSNDVNSMGGGSVKSTKGWLKFWSDKKRFTLTKKRQIEEGRLKSPLTLLEKRIFALCEAKPFTQKKKKVVKQEPYHNGDDEGTFDEEDDLCLKRNFAPQLNSRLAPTQTEERQLTLFENMIGAMDQQASALAQMAQASLTNSKAMERIAEASHLQAVAVDRLVSSFESISGTTQVIRNAILGIDYTLKRCCPNPTRENSTLFS